MANVVRGPEVSEREFPNAAASVAAARKFVLGALGHLSGRDVDSISVMVSELASNSVRHTDSPFVITIERDARQVRIAVRDHGTGMPVVREPAPLDGSGRGLRIIEVFADRWGIEPVVNGGKSVWFALVTAPEAPAVEIAAAHGG